MRDFLSGVVVAVLATTAFMLLGTTVFLVVNLIEHHGDTLQHLCGAYRYWLLGLGCSATFGGIVGFQP